MKKLLALLTASALLITVFAGCKPASNNATPPPASQGAVTATAATKAPELPENLKILSGLGEYPVVTKPITLKMMGSKGGSQGEWVDMKLFKVWSAKTGINFEFVTVPKDNWDEKKNLAFASGDLPDFFYAGQLKEADEMNYGKQGLLVPLNDLIDKYSVNLKKVLTNESLKRAITTPGGKIYSTAYFDDMNRNATQKVWFNKAWTEKVGMQLPTTTDELYNVLKAFAQKDPNGNQKADEIPISWTENGFRKTLSWWGLGCNIDTYLGNAKGKVYYAPTEPAYKDYLMFYNKLFTEKLVDNESFTQTTAQLKAKGKETSLLLGAFSEAGPFIVVPEKNNEDYVALKPLKAKDGSQSWPMSSGVKRGTFAITNKNKYPEATMKMIDWVYSKEGALTSMRGVAGEDFKYTNPEQTRCELVIPAGFTNFEEYRAKKLTPNSGSTTPGLGGGTLPVVYNPLNTYIDNQVEENLVPFWFEPYPLVYLESAEQKEVATIGADINNYVLEQSARFITGDLSIEKEYENFVKELEKMGVKRYVEVYQKAYDVSLKVK